MTFTCSKSYCCICLFFSKYIKCTLVFTGCATRWGTAFTINSVNMSVHHTRESHLNCSWYRMCFAPYHRTMSSFFRPNCATLNLGVYPQTSALKRHPLWTPKIWPVLQDIFKTVWDRIYYYSLIRTGKSHMGFPLVPKSVTLNGVTTVILHYFTKFRGFVGIYVKVVRNNW